MTGTLFLLLLIAPIGQDEKPLVPVPSLVRELFPNCSMGAHDAALRKFDEVPVTVSQGASEFALPGSPGAIEAAIALGATQVKVRLLKTLDVSVTFPDPTIELHLDGIGTIENHHFEELQLHSARFAANESYRVPRAIHSLSTFDYLVDIDTEEGSWTLSEAALAPKDFTDVTLPAKAPMEPVSIVDEDLPKLSKKELRKLADKRQKFDQALPDGYVVSDPRAILTMLKQLPRAVPPIDTTPKELQPAGNFAEYEAIVLAASRGEPHPVTINEKAEKEKGEENEAITPRLAMVRLAIYAPSRLIALAPELADSKEVQTRRQLAWNLGMIAKHRRGLVTAEIEGILIRLLHDPDESVRAEAAEACGRAQLAIAAPAIVKELQSLDALDLSPEELRSRIESRAKLAQALGFLGVKSPEVIDVLKELVRQPTEHPDVNWSRLDGALAAWSLGRLGAKEGAGVLSDALLTARSVRIPVNGLAEGETGIQRGLPIDRVHWFAAFALAELGTDDALIALETAMNTPPDAELPENDRLGGLAARALREFRTASRAPILGKLLVHENPLVRRAGVLGCLAESDPDCRTLLELGASWAVPWWDVQHGN